MIPVLLAGAAAVWGINNMAEAESQTNQVASINKEAAQIADTAYNRVKNSHGDMTDTLVKLGKTKKSLMDGNINSTFEIIGKSELQQNAIELLTSIKQIDTDDNHGWATFGALGGATLGFGVVAAPVFILYSIIESDKADTALYNAKTKLDETKVYQEKCKNIQALFNAIATRGRQIDDLLGRLNYYFDSAVYQLQQVRRINGYEYRNYPPEHRAVVFYSWQIMQTVKNIIDTSMINEATSLNSDMERPLKIGQQILKTLSSAG